MGYRYQVPGLARACVVLALSVLVSSVAPSQVGLAQSAPPPLTPWRGLVDHASVNVSGQASQESVDLIAKSLSADGRFVPHDVVRVGSGERPELIPGRLRAGPGQRHDTARERES